MNQNQFLLQGAEQAEILVQCRMGEIGPAAREVEDQTRVVHAGQRLWLCEALRDITLDCFAAWDRTAALDRDACIREGLARKEAAAAAGQELVLGLLDRPLLPQAVARTLLLGHNFLRTLDICWEALLRYPSQKSLTRKPLKTQVGIDWAIGGIREWACNFPYAFELGADGKPSGSRLAHVPQHYETERGARSQISHKQIANIFLLRDSTVADLERRAMAQLRAQLAGDALDRPDQE